jgi:GTP-binding protein
MNSLFLAAPHKLSYGRGQTSIPAQSRVSMALRNIAIIAHVDHGKTTLVDQLFRQSGTFRDNQRVEERAMDSNDLEKERGITILAKCTSVEWEDTRINIVDTPGHADFGGEVERILSMVDGVILLVDSSEGAMPQTKFVTGKALRSACAPSSSSTRSTGPTNAFRKFWTKCSTCSSPRRDRRAARFPRALCLGPQRLCLWTRQARRHADADVRNHRQPRPRPVKVNRDAPFQFLVTLLDRDNFLGRILTGRIAAGHGQGEPAPSTRSTWMATRGNRPRFQDPRLPRAGAGSGRRSHAGDIISIAGLTEATVAHTIADTSVMDSIPSQPIDPPTLSMRFAVNDSPMAGREGSKVTSRMIRDRLFRESESQRRHPRDRKRGQGQFRSRRSR